MTPSKTVKLTPREREIIRTIVEAHSNKEISAQLGITEQSVKNRLTRLYRKFGVKNRLQLMRLLLREVA